MSKFLALLAPLALFASPALADDASAADQVQELDGQSKSKRGARGSKGEVREVVRGFYMKANVGSLIFVGPRGQSILSPGTSLALTVGQDVLDKEKTSAAWEVFFHQSLNNGAKYFSPEMAAAVAAGNHIQGDIHTFTGGVAGEYSTYLTPRLGLGIRGGGGVSFAPLLMDSVQYELQVLNGPFANQPSDVHGSPLFLVFAGPTVEYYTKLSHFSIGVDASFSMYIGLDYGVDASGFMKYTF